ncbi:hypothetical protein LSAT2_000210 [Lamellibrachia satsuma]|nr:hypothetical protein LSAT2_000210 [Lamellibrachia satsuma]
MTQVASPKNPERFLLIQATSVWDNSQPENYDMATRNGCKRVNETVWSSKVFAVMVLVMIFVATTASVSTFSECIEICKILHSKRFEACLKEMINNPLAIALEIKDVTKFGFCHQLCHYATDKCIVACHETNGMMP